MPDREQHAPREEIPEIDPANEREGSQGQVGRRHDDGDTENWPPKSVTTSRRQDAERSVGKNRNDCQLDESPFDPPQSIGRFVVKELLGKGAFGFVYRATDEVLQRDVAIKVSRLQEDNVQSGKLDKSTTHDASLLQEARALAELDHPQIVTVFDIGQLEDGRSFFVSEYVRGTALDQYLKSHSFSPLDAARFVSDVATVLHLAHKKGVFHRDIKPGNLMITADQEPVVVDFGLALRQHQISSRPAIAGTPRYMSPEQAAGKSEMIDGRTDIFSLGVVLYELLTGQAPFAAKSGRQTVELIQKLEPRPPRQIDDSIPQRLEQICLRAIAKDPVSRYATADDFAGELNEFLNSNSTLDRPPQRRVFMIGAVGITAAALLIAIPLSLFWRTSDSANAPPAEVGLPAVATVLIESIEIKHLEDGGEVHLDRGALGSDSYQVRLGDAVMLRATLSRPAYCYWIALRPDGVQEICFPEDPSVAPEMTDRPSYPSGDQIGKVVYGLTDGTGLQSFVLLVSEDPLPPFAQWQAANPSIPWIGDDSATAGTVYRNEGEWIDLLSDVSPDRLRGKGTSLKGTPKQLAQLMDWFQAREGFTAVEIWAFPVTDDPMVSS